MDMNEAVSKAIAAERAIAGITVRDLSARARIPMSSLMRILGNDRQIKVNQIAQIASVLEIYPHEIIEHAENLMERAEETRPPFRVVDSDVEDELKAAKDVPYSPEAEYEQ